MPTEQYTTYISRQMAEIERQRQLAVKYQKKVRYTPPPTEQEESAKIVALGIVGAFCLIILGFLLG